MRIGLFFQTPIPQGNATSGNFTSLPEGLTWFDFILFGLLNHLQIGAEGKNWESNKMPEEFFETIFNNSFNNSKDKGFLLSFLEKNKDWLQNLEDLKLVFQEPKFQEAKLDLQNIDLPNANSQDPKVHDIDCEKQDAQPLSIDLIMLLPFFFKLAQENSIQENTTQKNHEELGSGTNGIKEVEVFTFLNKEVLKEIAFKGIPDEKHLVEIAKKLDRLIEENPQLVENVFLAKLFKKIDKKEFSQAFNRNNTMQTKGDNVPSYEGIDSKGLKSFYELALSNSENFKEESKNRGKEGNIFNIKDIKQSLNSEIEKLEVQHSEIKKEESVKEAIKENITADRRGSSIEDKFLQAYFNIHKGFQPASFQQHFAMVSKQNPQTFHKVHLNELATFIKDFSVELLPEGEKMARLTLEPPDLGRLDLEVKVKDKKVEILAKVEKPEALHEIRQHLHQIKVHFEEAGLQLKEFQLSLAENLAGGGEFFAERKGEGKSSDKERKQGSIEVGGIEGEAVETAPLINQKGHYYYIA